MSNPLLVVAPTSLVLINLVKRIASELNRPQRPLHLQALLQLPRVADVNGIVDYSESSTLLREIAIELPREEEWIAHPKINSPLNLKFGEVSTNEAERILNSYHYLRSARIDGRSYGLYSEDSSNIFALSVSSPLDVDHIWRLLKSKSQAGIRPRVISRVFAFEGSPRNTISHLLSLTIRAEKKYDVTDYVTYVNPNMGFKGTSYIASNWRLLGEEPGTSYRYLDNRYITERKLMLKFNTIIDQKLRELLGDRYSISRMPLLPLQIFYYSLQH